MAYPQLQLSKALQALELNPDSRTAQKRVKKWYVFEKKFNDNELTIGSSQPVKNYPKWVTLEVLHGGFASGRAMAGGSLSNYEQQKISELAEKQENFKIKSSMTSKQRHFLNLYFLSDEGMAELLEALHTGKYLASTPEENALLVVAYLIENDQAKKAKSVIEELLPLFGTLRFFPEPSTVRSLSASKLSIKTVDQVIGSLENVSQHEGALRQRTAFEVWTPLADRALVLMIDSIEGDLPILKFRPDGSVESCTGALPLSVCDQEWLEKRNQLLKDFKRAAKSNQRTGRAKTKGSLGKMIDLLKRHKSQGLTSRESAQLRTVIALCIDKRGLPGSDECIQLRSRQAEEVAKPLHAEVAPRLVSELTHYQYHQGLESLGWMGSGIPESLKKKIAPCLLLSLDELFAQRKMSSGEMLASLASQITAQFYLSASAQPEAGRLLQSLYYSFSKRRSLLLLNLGKQVKLQDIPWFAAIAGIASKGSEEVAFETFKTLCEKNLEHFPYTQLPNKLLQELRSLSALAKLDQSFVEELAADIFMGKLSPKFHKAAVDAFSQYKNTLYSKYYQIEKIDGNLVSQAHKRLGLKGKLVDFYFPSIAQNGAILEQVSILTSHSLSIQVEAASFDSPRYLELCDSCLEWICKQSGSKKTDHYAKLRTHKNIAYAWRNLVFYLSQTSEREQRDWIERRLSSQGVNSLSVETKALLSGLKSCLANKPYRACYGWVC